MRDRIKGVKCVNSVAAEATSERERILNKAIYWVLKKEIKSIIFN